MASDLVEVSSPASRARACQLAHAIRSTYETDDLWWRRCGLHKPALGRIPHGRHRRAQARSVATATPTHAQRCREKSASGPAAEAACDAYVAVQATDEELDPVVHSWGVTLGAQGNKIQLSSVFVRRQYGRTEPLIGLFHEKKNYQREK